MNKVEAYSRGISDAYRLKNALAITLNDGVDFTNDEVLNREEGEGQDIHLVSQTESFYFDAKTRRATQEEKETAGNLIVEVKVNIPGGKTEKRHYLITNLTKAKVLTERSAAIVLMKSNYFVLGSQDKRRVLAEAHKKHYTPQTLKSLMSDSDGLKLVQKGGKTYSLFNIFFGFVSSLFGEKAPKVLTQEAVQAKNVLIAERKALVAEEAMTAFREALTNNTTANLVDAINAGGDEPEAIIRNLTSVEILDLKTKLAGYVGGEHDSAGALTKINGLQVAIKEFDVAQLESLHQELVPSRAIGLWVLQSVILLSVGLILLGVVTVSGTGIAFGAFAFTLTSPASWIGLLLLVGIVAPGLPGYLLKSGGAVLRFIGALGALMYQAVGNFAYDIHELDGDGKADGDYKAGKDGVWKGIGRALVRFFVLPLIVVPIAFALNLPAALFSKQSPFSKIEIHNTRALVVGAPGYSKGKEINLYHGLARFYTWSAKTLVIAVSLAVFALCIASLFLTIPSLIPVLTVAADVLGYALLPFTFGQITGPAIVSLIVPLLLAGPTSIILVAIFALAVAAIVSYVWWKSLRRGINDARSNPEAAFSKAAAVVHVEPKPLIEPNEVGKTKSKIEEENLQLAEKGLNHSEKGSFIESEQQVEKHRFWDSWFGKMIETRNHKRKRLAENSKSQLKESLLTVEDNSKIGGSHIDLDQAPNKDLIKEKVGNEEQHNVPPPPKENEAEPHEEE